MTVETFDVNAQSVSVTATAAEHFRAALAASGLPAVRISVRDSGCTGYKYVLEEVREQEDGDLAMTLENGVKLFVDDAAIPVIRGTEIDYEREGINHVLKFNNPNVVAECGCGESFNVK